MKEIVYVGCCHIAAPAATGASDRAVVHKAYSAPLQHPSDLGDIRAELRFIDMDKNVERPHSVNRFAFNRREAFAVTDRKTRGGTVAEPALALAHAGFGDVDADQPIAAFDEVLGPT